MNLNSLTEPDGWRKTLSPTYPDPEFKRFREVISAKEYSVVHSQTEFGFVSKLRTTRRAVREDGTASTTSSTDGFMAALAV